MRISLNTGLLLASLAAFASGIYPAIAGGSAGVIVTSVTAGAGDPNGKVPAINAVPGAGVANADLSFPLAILTHGTAYDIQMTSQNTTFGGTCRDSYRLTQVQSGKTVTLLSGETAPYSCAAGTVWAWYLGSKAVPDSPGSATLTGTVTAGKNKVSMKVPVEIE